MSRKKIVLTVLSFILSLTASYAQRASVSVDVLKSAMAIPNISTEILLSDRLTLNLEAAINPFDECYSNLYTKQITLSPELRYWFKRPLYSHFVGVNLMGSIYDVGYNDSRNSGRIAALGIAYGYSIYLSSRWSLTPSLGVGIGYGENISITGTESVDQGYLWKPMVTRFGLSFSYLID